MRTNNQVEVWVFRATKEGGFLFLVLKRNPKKGGFWQPITGGVEKGETFRDATYRELKEETGVSQTRKVFDTGYSFDFSDHGMDLHEKVFAAEVEEDADIVISNEHTEFKWVTKEEALDEYLKYPGNKKGLIELCKILKINKEG